jgi:hypothetical protein
MFNKKTREIKQVENKKILLFFSFVVFVSLFQKKSDFQRIFDRCNLIRTKKNRSFRVDPWLKLTCFTKFFVYIIFDTDCWWFKPPNGSFYGDPDGHDSDSYFMVCIDLLGCIIFNDLHLHSFWSLTVFCQLLSWRAHFTIWIILIENCWPTELNLLR